MTQAMLEKMAIAAIETDIADNVRPELRKKLISLSVGGEVVRMRAALQALRDHDISDNVVEAMSDARGNPRLAFSFAVDAALQEKPEQG